MKEATGELNSTVIVVITVGVLMTFFFSYLWPIIKHNFEAESQCSKATCVCDDKTRKDHNGNCYCSIDGGESFECVYKG